MEIVTRRENTLRGDTIQARNLAKKACKYGHAFDEANTRIIYRKREHGVGIERRCRTCSSLWMAADRAIRKEKV
jgi:hypothetical protein